MDYNRSIVVVGDKDNQAKLFTQLEPIRLSQNKSLAIKSLFHGTVYNINNNNNKVHYQITPIGKKIMRSLLMKLLKNTLQYLKATIQTLNR